MADILKLVPKQAEAVDDAHAIAMQFLTDAMNKKATFVMVLMMNDADEIMDGWSTSGMIRPFTLVGGMEELKRRFMAANIEQR